MKTIIRQRLFTAILVSLVAVASEGHAALVTWNVDSAQSFMRLNIPDQVINLDGTSVTVRIRNNQNTSTWSDAGGRRAFLDGQIATNYNGTSISFLSGQHNLYALESGSFRPNPAAYDTSATNEDSPDGTYSDTSGAPAAFAGRIRSTVSLLNFDPAVFAFRNVMLDIASGSVPVTAGAFSGALTDYGIDSMGMDLDGQTLVVQSLPDLLNAPVSDLMGLNTSGGNIVDLGAGLLRLNYFITTPIVIDFSGVQVNATFSGQIVAYTIPEPSSLALASCAALGLCWAGRRRFALRTGPSNEPCR